jgi:flagellar basal body-associated protein FliL
VRATTLTIVGYTVIIVLVLVVALAGAGVGAMVAMSRKRSAAAAVALDAGRSRSTIAPAAPMTGLESALDQAMDRSGRKMREKIDAEAEIVDGLKSSDDTGPILRRALDRVEHTGEQQPPAS